MASTLCRPRCALKLIERVPQQNIYLRKRNKSQDPLLWTKSKIWPCECSSRATPCKVDPLTHPDEQLTRPTVNLKPKSNHPPFFNIWKNQIKSAAGVCACLWLGNMLNSGITINCDEFSFLSFFLFFPSFLFFWHLSRAAVCTLGMSPLSLFLHFRLSLTDTHTHTQTHAHTGGWGWERQSSDNPIRTN